MKPAYMLSAAEEVLHLVLLWLLRADQIYKGLEILVVGAIVGAEVKCLQLRRHIIHTVLSPSCGRSVVAVDSQRRRPMQVSEATREGHIGKALRRCHPPETPHRE